MKIKNILLLTFSIIILLFIINIFVSIHFMYVERQLEKRKEYAELQSNIAKEIYINLNRQLKELSDILILGESEINEFDKYTKILENAFVSWEYTTKNELKHVQKEEYYNEIDEISDLYDLKKSYKKIYSDCQGTLNYYYNGDKEEAVNILSSVIEIEFDIKFTSQINQIINNEESEIINVKNNYNKQKRYRIIFTLVLLGITLITIIFIFIIFIYTFFKPLQILNKNMIEGMNAEFKFKKSKIKIKNEIGEVAQSYYELIEKLKDSMISVDRLNLEIDKRKKIENELKTVNNKLAVSIDKAKILAQEANTANKAKSVFLANMSHEIRTPMNSIMGFSDLLMREKLSSKQKEYIKSIILTGNNLLKIIDDILDLSKIEEGKLKINFVEFPIVKIIDSIFTIMLPLANEKKLEFIIEYEDDLPVTMNADMIRLKQCMINLISNAIKFTDKGYVKIKVTKDDNRYPSKMICFNVEDTGMGIDKDKIDMIFDSFSQAENSTTRKFGGTGLGLAITKKLAQLMNGYLTVNSTVKKGSSFILTIPVGVDLIKKNKKSDESNKTVSIKTINKNLKKKKALVVEDNLLNQKLIEKILDIYGLNSEIVGNGADAVEKAVKNKYDVIFMDIQLPILDGYEATKKIREKGLKLPIIAITAYAIIGDKQKCIESGCNDYIKKPIDLELFKQCLQKYNLMPEL